MHRTCPVLQGNAVSGTRQPRVRVVATPLKFTGLSGVHRTVSGAPRKSGLRNSPALGIHFSCSAIIHRTVRCTPDCPVQPRSNGYFGTNGYLQAHSMRARGAQSSGTPILAHRTVYSTCLVRHRTSRRAQKIELQRSNPMAFGDVAVAPDMSGVHRTVRCAIEQTASPNG